MKEELTIEQMEISIKEMRRFKEEHPKANISYDTKNHRINITYPLPNNYWELKDIKIDNDHFRKVKR